MPSPLARSASSLQLTHRREERRGEERERPGGGRGGKILGGVSK
jgi:hypothetical protein